MFCLRCGALQRNEDRFCAACGASTSARPRRPWRVVGAILGGVLPLAAAGVAIGSATEQSWPQSWFASSDRTNEMTPSDATNVTSTLLPPDGGPSLAPEAAAPDFSAIFAEVSSGVFPVYASACGGEGSGSAFLIDRDTVVTAEHVVHGAVAVSVQVDGVPYAADVVGVDEAADLAVLELHTAAAGQVFRFADADPERGDSVAALGYPDGDPLRLSEGTVDAVDQSKWIEDEMLHDLIGSDATSRPGNSGGPLIDAHGEVVGVVVAGQMPPGELSWAVQVSAVEPKVTNPAAMAPPAAAPCAEPPLGPDDQAVAGLPSEDEVGFEVALTFARYFGGINSGDYLDAYDQLSTRLRAGSTYEAFADGVSTSYDYGFEVRDAQLGQERPRVTLEFVSLQDPQYGPSGESCTVWLLEYELVRAVDGQFLIDEVNPPPGADAHMPCQ